MNVDSIVTDADLAAEIGGLPRLNSTQALIAIRDTYRAQALQDVLRALETRSPPVREGDLTDP